MGNTRSLPSSEDGKDYWWPNISLNANHQTMEGSPEILVKTNATEDSHDVFEEKREKRKLILAAKKVEVQSLRENLESFMIENKELRLQISRMEAIGHSVKCNQCSLHEVTVDKLIVENAALQNVNTRLTEQLSEMEDLKSKNRELNITMSQIQMELQQMNKEIVCIETERMEYQNHIKALKDVIKLTKEMVQIREDQIKDLNIKIKTVEEILACKEMKMMSDELREEYERQLRNIRNLRTLYEVRQRVDRREREQLDATLAEQKALFEAEQAKTAKLEATIEEQQQDISKKYDQIASLESNLGLSNAECRDLKQEINAINQVFSQILLSFNNSQNLDFDRLIKDLQDNHDLLAKIIVNEKSPEVSASQTKVLLDLINQSDDCTNPNPSCTSEETTQTRANMNTLRKTAVLQTIPEETESSTTAQHLNSAEQIVENLPKVWKVLIELLSQQNPPCNITEGNSSTETSCYKSVETPNGPKLVLSVSQTFIRLKDLILEKKSLEKEMGRLKNLNGHLEERLQEQEKRLHLVSGELSKTWHVVGNMQKQHQQLHTQERILRYELAHKRKLLTELKQELEYCREKWVQAREKNTETEIQWKQLRSEFASRKVKPDNYSAESGYSDDKSSSDEEIDVRSEKEDDVSVDVDETEEKDDGDAAAAPYTSSNITSRSDIELVNVEIGQSQEVTLTFFKEMKPTDSSEINAQELNQESSGDGISSCTTDTSDNLQASNSTNSQTSQEVKSCPSVQKPHLEDILRRREERLQRLEEQCKSLVSKVSKTNVRGNEISDKLDNLHEMYGDLSVPVANAIGTQDERPDTANTVKPADETT